MVETRESQFHCGPHGGSRCSLLWDHRATYTNLSAGWVTCMVTPKAWKSVFHPLYLPGFDTLEELPFGRYHQRAENRKLAVPVWVVSQHQWTQCDPGPVPAEAVLRISDIFSLNDTSVPRSKLHPQGWRDPPTVPLCLCPHSITSCDPALQK